MHYKMANLCTLSITPPLYALPPPTFWILWILAGPLAVVGKLTTFDLWPLPLGGGAWGAGSNMWHPEIPASYESLPTPLATQIPTLWVHISGGRGHGGALILGRCRAFDLFASVDAHLWPLGGSLYVFPTDSTTICESLLDIYLEFLNSFKLILRDIFKQNLSNYSVFWQAN